MINTHTFKVEKEIELEEELKQQERYQTLKAKPVSAILSSDGQTLFIINTESASVSVINTRKLINVGEIAIEAQPYQSFFNGDSLCILHPLSGSLTCFDVNENKVTFNLGVEKLHGPLLSSDEKYLFALTYNINESNNVNEGNEENSVFIMNIETMESNEIKVGRNAQSLMVFKPSKEVLVRTYHVYENAQKLRKGDKEVKVEAVLSRLNDLRKVMDKVSPSLLGQVLSDTTTLLMFLQEKGMDNPPLKSFFDGVEERVNHPFEETTFDNDAFHWAYEDFFDVNAIILARGTPQKSMTLAQIQSKIYPILTKRTNLTEIEEDVLTFMGLQMLSPFILDDGVERAAFKDIRLQLLHFIDGYNCGKTFEIPLPRMSEEEIIGDEKGKYKEKHIHRDNRTVHDFIRLIEKDKFRV